MFANGFNYWLTKHGRARFIERIGKVSDSEILSIAITGKEGYEFIWKPDRDYPLTGRRLVTVKYKEVNHGSISSNRTVLHSSKRSG